MISRRSLLVACSTLAICRPLTGLAQQGNKLSVVGFLGLNVDIRLAQMREGLRQLGYVEGRNIRIEERSTGDRYSLLDDAANELVRLKVDVIVTTGATATSIAAKATSSIPIVMVAGLDPVQEKFAQSLAHPGKNLTGITTITHDLDPKRLQLMKEAIPGLTRLGILWTSQSSASKASLAQIQDASRALRLNLQIAEARSAEKFDLAFETLARSGTHAFVLMTGSMFEANRKALLESAARHRMAGLYSYGNWSDDGGLLAYGADPLEPYRRSAIYVDKILKGARPGDIPIELPTKYELVVNLKSAEALKIRIPQSILARADRVIR